MSICLIFEAMLFLYMGIFMGEKNRSFPFKSAVPAEKKKVAVILKEAVTMDPVAGQSEKLKKEETKKLAAEKAAKAAKAKEEELKKIPDLAPLEKKVRAELKGKEGHWQVYMKVLNNGDKFVINSHASRSASLIKFFVAGAYLKGVKDGDIKETVESKDDLDLMIRESSNDAWIRLEDVLHDAYKSRGSSMVEDFIYENRYRGSERDTGDDPGNLTSANDMGRVLEELYTGRFVSKEASERILTSMKKQTHRAKIPAGIPKGVTIANKTGELETVENDAAIVYTDKCDYILVVMANKVNGELLGVPEIKKVSSMVYKYIMGE